MFDAIVLAGGRATRLGGMDKPSLLIGADTMLQRSVKAVADAQRIVIAGPQRDGLRSVPPVTWCQEDPPGGGPVAGIASAVAGLRADLVVLVAADLPWFAGAVPVLMEALSHHDAAVLLDRNGRPNYVAAAWRLVALRRSLANLAHTDGAALRELYAAADVVEVLDLGWGQDCDTWDDVHAARARARTEGTI